MIILGDGDYKDVVDILNKCNLEKLKIIVKINPYIPKVGKTDIISYFQKFFLFKFKELKSFSTREVIDFADIIITGGESSLSFEAVIRRKDLRIIRIFSGKYPPVSEKENAFFTIGNPKTFNKTLLKNNFNIVSFLEFPDHYQYTNKDLAKIKNIAKNLSAKIITTEKDYLRISSENNNDINYIKTELYIKNEKDLINLLKSYI